MKREEWKAYYRMLRIYRREQHKALQDMITFGYGFLSVDIEGYANHRLPGSVLDVL